MSNAPAIHEIYLLPDGVDKVVETKSTKIPNASTFHLEKEDHTLGNLLRAELLRNPKVLFAGYKMPHPLDHSVDLKLQTTADTSPLTVLQEDVNSLMRELGLIKKRFENEMTLHNMQSSDPNGMPYTVDRAYS
ncbi:DNA-directed RNA polymerase II subunit RPB11-a [Geranomyces variabilis]|uniref:DNA-directed RNA polymerase II subunit RPB11-a n=1 Tax=Geranomyces variabilis TaxID=109894 RepID=A0AAD5TLA2_9FUNG|nr:DNA-directed RNA polymerase II subunit RPB11-a [Geranomyces variabilis]